MMGRSRVALAGIAISIAACGGGGGSACVPTTDISGIWTGSATSDDVARGETGTIAATITQTGCTLGGTWTFSFGDAQLDRQFEVTGSSPQTSAVDLVLKKCTGLGGACDTVETCEFIVSGTLASATEIAGTYTTNDNCSFSEAGSFDITLQARLTPTPVPTVTATVTPTATATPTP